MSYYPRNRSFMHPSAFVKDGAIKQLENGSERFEKVLLEPLNASTREFVLSLKEYFSRKNGLTPGQLSAFEKVESAFAPEQKKAREVFNATFSSSEEMKANFKQALAYYDKGPYFNSIVNLAKTDPSFTPSEKQYKDMVENKYMQKVLHEQSSPPKFLKNSLVVIRKGNKLPFEIQAALKDKKEFVAFVVQTNSGPITSAVSGAKKYKILPLGSARVLEVEERYLKKAKKSVLEKGK